MSNFFRCAIIGITFALFHDAAAQEVRAVDLTTVEPRITLRTTPAPVEQIHKNSDGSFTVKGSAQGLLIGDCGVGANEPRALRTTLSWLDRASYVEGEPVTWEVKIENVGTVPVKLGISPHRSDLQPQDASASFRYEETDLRLSLRSEHGSSDLTNFTLYGSDSQPGTLTELRVGEWVRLKVRSRIDFPQITVAQILRGQAVGRIGLRHAKITAAPGTYGTSLMNECPRVFEGPGTQIEIARKKADK